MVDLFEPGKPNVVFAIGKGLFGETGGSQKSICEVASLFARDGYPTTIIFSEPDVSRYGNAPVGLSSRIKLVNVAGWREGYPAPGAGQDAPHGESQQAWTDAIERAQPDVLIVWFVGKPSLIHIFRALEGDAVPFLCAHRMDPGHGPFAAQLARDPDGKEAGIARELIAKAHAHSIQMPSYADFFPDTARERLWMIPNIVQPPAATDPLDVNDHGDRKIILNVARLHRQKNQALLVRAFACIAHLFPNWDVEIYGDGPEEAKLKALVAMHGMERRIRLMGVSQHLAPIYRAAHLFAFPSVFEGFSRAHGEAMAHGLPSIGLRECDSSRFLIGESGGGRLAENNALSFARELSWLLSRPQILEELGQRAARHVTRFDEPVVFAEWKRMVASALPERPRRPQIRPADAGAAVDVAACRHVAFSIGALKSYVGGAEKSLGEIATFLAKIGYDVTIIMSEEGVAQSAPTFYPVHGNVRLRNLHHWLEEGCKAPDKGRKEWLQERACQVVREVNPDLLICFTMEKSLLYSKAVRGTDIPYVIAHRNDPAEKLEDQAVKAKDRSGYMRAVFESWDRAVAQTVQLEPYRDFFPADIRARVVTIPNVIHPVKGVDAEQLPNSGVILNVGRLRPQKNQQLLIRAFAEVAAEFPGWQVHIYGEGPERSRLQRLIDELNLTGRALLQGTTQAMEPVYRAASVFAFPSLFEGFSRAHGEAMACGLPSLGLTQCVSSRILIGESGAGLLTENTVEGFAHGLRRLMANRALRRQCQAKALTHVERYAPERVHGHWQALIDALARRGTPAIPAERALCRHAPSQEQARERLKS